MAPKVMDRRWIDLESIQIRDRLRAPDMDRVSEIAKSISEIGLLNPPAVRFVESMVINGVEELNVPILIVGHHRILALQQLGKESVECDVYNVDPLRAELMEIAENLHRAELSALERDEQIARWIELTTIKPDLPDAKPAQVAQVSGGRGNKGGVSEAARELNIERTDANRARKVASLSPEAKQAAREAGLDDNRSALLEAAKESEPEKQIAKLRELRKQREVLKALRPTTIAVMAKDENLKKQLARAKEEAEEKEGQRKAQEHRANIAVKQVDSATNRAMFAEADKERLQAEVDRLTAENEDLRRRCEQYLERLRCADRAAAPAAA